MAQMFFFIHYSTFKLLAHVRDLPASPDMFHSGLPLPMETYKNSHFNMSFYLNDFIKGDQFHPNN